MLLLCEYNLLVIQSVRRFHVVKYFVICDLQSAFHTQLVGIFIVMNISNFMLPNVSSNYKMS
jgi:hypothetical protein